jgi:hypothetical protein
VNNSQLPPNKRKHGEYTIFTDTFSGSPADTEQRTDKQEVLQWALTNFLMEQPGLSSSLPRKLQEKMYRTDLSIRSCAETKSGQGSESGIWENGEKCSRRSVFAPRFPENRITARRASGDKKRRNALLQKEKRTFRHATCGNRTGSF